MDEREKEGHITYIHGIFNIWNITLTYMYIEYYIITYMEHLITYMEEQVQRQVQFSSLHLVP